MPIFEAFLLLPEFAAAGEAALGVEAALAAGAAGAGAAGLFGAEAVGATLGAEALGTAGAAAAVPEAATGINAINPELFASAVNSGAVNPATAFSDIPGLADKLANLPAGQDLYRPDLVAEVNRFGASPMANQGNMVANPYAQITASNTPGPMAATPPPAAGSSVPASSMINSSNALNANGLGSSVIPPDVAPDFYNFSPETGGGANAPGLGGNIQNTPPPTEPPGFLDKLSDAFSPLQKGFEKAQEFAKKNPLIAGPGLTALSRMVSSGSSMPDTTYKGPLSKFKLSKNFKGNFANPQDYQYRRASGGIIDYKEGGTTETPLTHADMGIAVDNDLDTKYLDPYSAARIRLAKQKKLARVSLPEMQAPTPMGEINVGPRTAAHGGIMQVKRFTGGEGVEGGADPNTADGNYAPGNEGDPNTAGGNYAPGNYGDPNTAGGKFGANPSNADVGLNYGEGVSGAKGTGVGGYASPGPSGFFGRGYDGLFGPPNNSYLGTNINDNRGGGGGGGLAPGSGGGDSGVDTTPITPVTPITNIDDLKPQFVNPEMYRPTSNPLAHYAKYDNEDYNYLRTPSMAARSSPFNNNAMAEVLATVNKAKGGNINSYAQGGMSSLGGYARGGMPRLLDGPGDGMSDNIPATINDRQPARLADGEFVVPADVVSHLGNGSTKAGSKRLHLMMDQVRKARTGNPKQGKRINPDKFMPR